MSAVSAGYYSGLNHKLFERVPPAARTILEVGCGYGRLGAALKAQEPSREVWGLELSPSASAVAAQVLDRVLTGNVESMDPLPLPEGYFDCVLFGDVLEHMRDPDALVRRLRPHLAPSATLVCCVPNVGHWSVIVELLRGQFRYQDQGLLDRTHVRFFTPLSLREMLWDTGYMIVEEEGCAQPLSGAVEVLSSAARALGLDADRAASSAEVYQQVYTFRERPNGTGHKDILLGPHVGELGRASKRCSVVVVTYNSAPSIASCLESVLRTLGPDDELVVVDNASGDGTVDVVDAIADPRLRLIKNSDNLGYARGANVGALASHGAFIIFLNPDTVVWPGWIERMQTAGEGENVGAVGPLADNVAGDQFVGHYLRGGYSSPEEVCDAVATLNLPPMGTRLLMGFCLGLRREVLNTCGLLDERLFLGADDLEISWRLRELGYRLVVSTDTLVHHVQGVSFNSIGADRKRELVASSDAALVSKLQRYYSVLPTSHDIWRNEIFQEALTRA